MQKKTKYISFKYNFYKQNKKSHECVVSKLTAKLTYDFNLYRLQYKYTLNMKN